MRTRAADVSGGTDRGTLAALFESAALVVCNDTGVSHLADALAIPSVVIFSGSDPGRWAPADCVLHRILLVAVRRPAVRCAVYARTAPIPIASLRARLVTRVPLLAVARLYSVVPTLLRSATRLTLDLLFPPQCALCGASRTLLCDFCIAMLPLAAGQRCERCWTPATSSATCAHCVANAPAFSSIVSPFEMDGDARMLVHRLKYDGMSALGEPMAITMLDAARGIDADLVVPVPLHGGRQRSRGYNQSEMLAKPIAQALSIELDVRAARRTRATAPLAMAMSRDDRRRIVAGAFAGDPRRVAGRRILLVDDVTTTGATLDACAAALLGAGAVVVRCVTFARAG